MPMRSASSWLSETLVAPVSTMKRTLLPLIVPLPRKWPPLSAVRTMRRPPPSLMRPPRLTWPSPRRSVTRLPLTSTTASLRLTLIRRMPSTVAPTATLRGLPSMTSSALLPRLPPIETLCASAPPAHSTATRPASAFIVVSIAEVVERERLGGDFLANQRHRRLQVVALGAGDAHRVALDRGLHLELALLHRGLQLLRGLGTDATLDDDHLLD